MRNPMLRVSSRSLYGTTQGGGNLGCPYGSSCGVVFKVSPSGNEEVLYAFTGGADGGIPGTSLIQDTKGNLYGTALAGGNLAFCANLGCGTVFKITSASSEQVLYAFTGGGDGAFPVGGLIWDGRGGFGSRVKHSSTVAISPLR